MESTSWNTLPDHSRVWIYQADRSLTDSDKNTLKSALDEFIGQWAAHGKSLSAGYKIHEPFFVVIAVDDKSELPTGCSIDSSVKLMTELGKELSVDFFNRMNAVLINTEAIIMVNAQTEKEELKELELSNFLLYNNLISEKGQLDSDWMIPAETSWLKNMV